MVVTIVGKYKKPWKLDNGKSGITCKLSVSCGEYVSVPEDNQVGEGVKYSELRCPIEIFDNVSVNDSIYISTDDDFLRIKQALLQDKETGMFLPIV